MNHLNKARHQIAMTALPMVAIATCLAFSAANFGIANIMKTSQDDGGTPDYVQPLNDAIDHLDVARAQIGDAIGKLESDDSIGAVEMKDLREVLASLVNTSYLTIDSLAADVLDKQGLAVAFKQLDTYVEDAIAALQWTRDDVIIDGTDGYLGHTALLSSAMITMSSYMTDVQVIIGAAWRDHNNEASFLIHNTPATGADAKRAARA